MIFRRSLALLGLCSAFLLSGCATGPQKFAVDDAEIRSILVPPVINATPQVEADSLMAATSTTPLANYGYYVFPVDTVKFVLESEALYEPERVRELGPEKLAEMFNSDAVLFIKVIYWDAQYIVLNTKTTVKAEYELYKADGSKIWSDTVSASFDSNSNSSTVFGLLTDAVIAAVNRAAPNFKPAAKSVNAFALRHWNVGPYIREQQDQSQQ